MSADSDVTRKRAQEVSPCDSDAIVRDCRRPYLWEPGQQEKSNEGTSLEADFIHGVGGFFEDAIYGLQPLWIDGLAVPDPDRSTRPSEIPAEMRERSLDLEYSLFCDHVFWPLELEQEGRQSDFALAPSSRGSSRTIAPSSDGQWDHGQQIPCREDLNDHVRGPAGASIKRHECRICGHAFRYPKDLKRHSANHGDAHRKENKGFRHQGPPIPCKIGTDTASNDFSCLASSKHIFVIDPTRDEDGDIGGDSPRSLGIPHTCLQLLSKAAVLASSSACLHVVSNYGVDRGRASPAIDIWSLGSVFLDMQDFLRSKEPDWLSSPEPLLVLAASVGAGYLLAAYNRMNARDRYQTTIVLMTLLIAFAFGMVTTESVLVTTFSIVPWAMYFALILSDAFHAGLRWRAQRAKQVQNDPEKQALPGDWKA